MNNFPGVYASPGGFTAGATVKSQKYFSGVYKTPERAFLKIRLFKHWIEKGFKPDEIPRLWTPHVVEAPKYKPVESYKIRAVIESGGSKQLSQDDMLNIATELQSLRIFKYGNAKTLRF